MSWTRSSTGRQGLLGLLALGGVRVAPAGLRHVAEEHRVLLGGVFLGRLELRRRLHALARDPRLALRGVGALLRLRLAEVQVRLRDLEAVGHERRLIRAVAAVLEALEA